MLRWFLSHGELLRVGVESTGSYGAGITRHLALAGVPVLEVTGPDPAARRAKGKDDALDAIAAAEAARTKRRVQVAKGPIRCGGGLTGTTYDAKNRRKVSPRHTAAASQHRCGRARGSAGSSPQPDAHATPANVRGLAAGYPRVP